MVPPVLLNVCETTTVGNSGAVLVLVFVPVVVPALVPVVDMVDPPEPPLPEPPL